ncbi:MAG: heparinase II/III domain-containing protein [Candidatus Latescibacterota bacterium]
MGYGDFNINLPDGENFAPDDRRVQEILAMLVPEPFHFGVSGDNRKEWDKLRNCVYGQRILMMAKESVEITPRPMVTNEIYESCWAKNSPADVNAVSPVMRTRLTLLPLAECLEPTGGYLDVIEEDILRLAQLKSWVHPSNDMAKEIYQGQTMFADLAAFHIASNLVAADYLLGERLKPKLRALIRSEIEWRIFKPFRERIESGKDVYWWVTVTHNWNSVCLAGLLGCALWLKEDLSERAWYVALVEKLIVYSEMGFTKSGFYTEGVGYWGYGFGHYLQIAEMLQMVTRGKLNWLEKPVVKGISQFGARMEIQMGRYPTFADCARDIQTAPWLVHWLNNRLEAKRLNRTTQKPIDSFEHIHFQMANQLLLILFHQVDVTQAFEGDFSGAIRDWFDDVQFLICRPIQSSKPLLAATFKGGHNGVNHNHNDLGTFTVLLGDRELLTDPGAEVYTNRTFSKDRYESRLLNSFGHPVPVVAGQLQQAGEQAQTVLIQEKFGDDVDELVLNLKPAYDVAHLLELTRRFRYQRSGDGEVVVTDRVAYSVPNTFETALITYANWQLGEDGAVYIGDGDAVLKVWVTTDSGVLDFDHCVIEESSTPTRLSWRFSVPVKEAEVVICVKVATEIS